MDEDHYVDVVDEEDRVIGKDLRSMKPVKGFITRVVGVLIRDSEGKYIICKRSPNKKTEPNKYDFTACGMVDLGESYEKAAKRELLEETTLVCELKLLAKQFFQFEEQGRIRKCMLAIFEGISDQELVLCDELVEYKKHSFDELQKEIKTHPELFTANFPCEIECVKEFLQK